MRNLVLLAGVVLAGCHPADPARVPWTTSHVVGQPEPPPPYKCVVAFPGLKFKRPLLITRAPGTDRLFVGERAKRRVMPREYCPRQGAPEPRHRAADERADKDDHGQERTAETLVPS